MGKKFVPDDFERIQKKYFDEIIEKNNQISDISYWYNSTSKAANLGEYNKFVAYKSDYGNSLKEQKKSILECVENWDKTSYDYHDFTLCSSATSASLIILTFLKSSLGIKNIVFESPCYFASVEQAKSLGFNTIIAATYIKDNFFFELKNKYFEDEPKVVWITQPRFGLGYNQEKEYLDEIIEGLNKKDIIIIDEATEQYFPSYLHNYNFNRDHRIIKFRSFFKGMGINGPRISYILHGRGLRKEMQRHLENVQGSIDIFSLNFAKELTGNLLKFKKMLRIANQQVISLRDQIQTYCINSNIELIKIENGYIGSIAYKYNSKDKGWSYFKRREELLKLCASLNLPVILGAMMNFAKDPDYEFIRVNFFNEETQLLNGIRVLTSSRFRSLKNLDNNIS